MPSADVLMQRRRERTARLLEGAVAPTLLRLAAPNVAVMLAQSLGTIAEAWYVARLGTPAIAGLALVFPLVMLTQMMSAGGMGGGISSAVARALGAGRTEDAVRLGAHALYIALGFGILFTGAVLGFGPSLYRLLGGSGATLEAALAYSNVLFAAAIVLWLVNSLASVLRGTGEMAVPSIVLIGAMAATVALSPVLMFGFGLGVAGAAAAVVVSWSVAAASLLWFLLSGRAVIRPSFAAFRPRGRCLAEILRVGAAGIATTALANATIIVATGLVGRFGAEALAGYGLGARLEYLQIPLVFGLGAALVAMIGTNVGAGQVERARRIALLGGALGAALTGAIGIFVAFVPLAWLRLFTDVPEVLAAGALYLRIVGPFYGFLGLGMALYFASQGAGRMGFPVMAAVVRFLVAALCGGALVGLAGNVAGVYAALAGALVVFGTVNALNWRRR